MNINWTIFMHLLMKKNKALLILLHPEDVDGGIQVQKERGTVLIPPEEVYERQPIKIITIKSSNLILPYF